jgi:hypothetical protein
LWSSIREEACVEKYYSSAFFLKFVLSIFLEKSAAVLEVRNLYGCDKTLIPMFR